MRWLLLATLPSLLDEMFLGFAGLFLIDKLGVAPQRVSLALMAPMLGGLLGLAWLERWGKQMTPRHILSIVALLTLVGLLGFITAVHAWLALLAPFIMGIGVAPWFPLAQAQAYAALPGRSGTVGALQSLFAPLEIAAPALTLPDIREGIRRSSPVQAYLSLLWVKVSLYTGKVGRGWLVVTRLQRSAVG